MAQAGRDQNSVPTLLGVSNVDGSTPVAIYADPVTHRLLIDSASGSGTVTTVSVVSANGFAGTVANATTTPAITLTTTITGILKGNGTAISAAVSGTDYAPATTGTSILKGDGAGGFAAATAGTDYVTASSTNTFTNKTFDTAGVGNSLSIAGVAVTANTGTGAVARATSPSFTTPTLGVATATTINKVTITAPATGSTLTIADGKTLTASNTLTFTGTDSSSVAFGTGGTVAYTANNLSVFASTTSSQLAGVISDETGSGALVFGTSPTLTTPTINQINASANTSISLNAGSYNTIQTYSPGAGGTATLDLSKGNIHHITMPAGNITIALSNSTTGQCFMVRILQDATGSRTVTWFTTIRWAGGSAPTLTTTASKADTMGFEVTGAGTYDGFVIGQNI